VELPLGKFSKTINFAADIMKLRFKLSTLLQDIGEAGSETGVLAAAAAIAKVMKVLQESPNSFTPYMYTHWILLAH